MAITRCGNFYGGGDLNWNRIVPGTIRSVLRGQRPVIRSDGSLVRDYFYVEDGAAAYMRLAEWLAANPERRGEAFNFSNETQVTVSELVARILALMGSDLVPDVRNEASQRDPGAVPRRGEGARDARLGAALLARRGARADDRLVPRGARSARVSDATPAARAAAATSRRCSRSARRRSRTRCVAPDRLDEPEPTFPLDLAFCPACSLVQITETVPPEVLFRDYVYFSSFSDTMLRHATELASSSSPSGLSGREPRRRGGENDGYLLGIYRARGVRVLGIEPAVNIAAVGAGARRDHDRRVLRLRARGATGCARERAPTSSTHTTSSLTSPELNGFVAGIAAVLADDGIAVIEVPYVKDMLDRCEFDTIYHEHLCYFSLTALDALVRRHRLALGGRPAGADPRRLAPPPRRPRRRDDPPPRPSPRCSRRSAPGA